MIGIKDFIDELIKTGRAGSLSYESSGIIFSASVSAEENTCGEVGVSITGDGLSLHRSSKMTGSDVDEIFASVEKFSISPVLQ